MAHVHKSDAEYVATTHNMARFFTEHRQVALVLLLATFVWGFFGYHNMPKRKDPNIPVRVASAQCPWPGATAEQVEQLVTRPIEQAVALNSDLEGAKPVGLRNPVAQLPRALGCLHPAQRQREGQGEAILRHEPEAESAQPAERRGADPVQQQFWRHGGADADRRQPDGRLQRRSRCAPSPSGRRSSGRARNCRRTLRSRG